MAEDVTLSFLVMFQGWVFDKLAKYGIGYFSRKASGWITKQLEFRMKISDKPKVIAAIIQDLDDVGATVCVTVNVCNYMPIRLKIEKVLGEIRTKGYYTKIYWNKTVKEFSHLIINDIERGENPLEFSFCVPIEVLKRRDSANWYLTFVSVFENKATKTFSHIQFKIRDSDVKRIQALPKES